VFGITDEKTFLDSAVIIRYIEKKDNQLIYKSGGGITIDSNIKREYEELINKVYIPV
jgi:para-aminobenzoate synthetase component 1